MGEPLQIFHICLRSAGIGALHTTMLSTVCCWWPLSCSLAPAAGPLVGETGPLVHEAHPSERPGRLEGARGLITSRRAPQSAVCCREAEPWQSARSAPRRTESGRSWCPARADTFWQVPELGVGRNSAGYGGAAVLGFEMT